MARFLRHQNEPSEALDLQGPYSIATVTLIAIVVGLAVGRMVPRYFTLVWTSDCVWVSREAQSLGRPLTICCAPVSDGTVEQYVSGRQLYSSGRCS